MDYTTPCHRDRPNNGNPIITQHTSTFQEVPSLNPRWYIDTLYQNHLAPWKVQVLVHTPPKSNSSPLKAMVLGRRSGFLLGPFVTSLHLGRPPWIWSSSHHWCWVPLWLEWWLRCCYNMCLSGANMRGGCVPIVRGVRVFFYLKSPTMLEQKWELELVFYLISS